jgi:putative tricarboxylic transport membrane protein
MIDQLIIVISDPWIILIAAWATILGIVMGALPGLTGPMAMSLLLSIAVYAMSVEGSVVAMMLIYLGGVYGGSLSAILLNVPGAPASAATALDGHPLAKRGQAGRVIGAVTLASFFGSLVSVALMATLTPWLVDFSLKFTAYELLILILIGIVISGSLSTEEPIKGWIAGILGLLIAMIGLDDINMHPRFSYDSSYLQAGIGLIAAVVGVFGISQVVEALRDRHPAYVPTAALVSRVYPRLSDFKNRTILIFRSGVIGNLVGILPGLGADMGAWVSYDVAKRLSKRKDNYGKGEMEGVIAAETGNNAVVPGSLIPVIALGLPGSAGAAIIMAGLFLHGLKPGPTFLIDNLDLFHYMVAGLLLGSFMMLIFGLIISNFVIYLLMIPRAIIMPVIVALGAMGAYASRLQFGDMIAMVVLGLIAYLGRRNGYPLAPFILGIVLGKLLDEYLRNATIISDGTLLPIVTRPISATLLVLLVFFIVYSLGLFTKRDR